MASSLVYNHHHHPGTLLNSLFSQNLSSFSSFPLNSSNHSSPRTAEFKLSPCALKALTSSSLSVIPSTHEPQDPLKPLKNMAPPKDAYVVESRKELVRKVCLAIEQDAWQSNTEITWLSHCLNPAVVTGVLWMQTDAFKALEFFLWAKKQDGFVHNINGYYRVFELLKRADAFEEIEGLVESMEEEGVGITSGLMNSILGFYASKGRVVEAAKTVNRIGRLGYRPSIWSLNEFLNALMELKKTDHVRAVFGQLIRNGVWGNKETYSWFLKSFCLKGKPDEGLLVLEEMKSKRCLPDAINYTMLVSSFCKSGRVEDARGVMDMMEKDNCRPNVYTYNALLKGVCNQGKADEGLELLNKMEMENVMADIFTYSILIDGLCKVENLERAKDMFCEALGRGLKPNSATYAPLLNAYCKNPHLGVDDALDLLKIISEKCEPDVMPYNWVISALCNIGWTESVYEVISLMQRHGCKPDFFSYNPLIKGLCRSHRLQEALDWLAVMEQGGLKPDIVAYNTVIDGLCMSGCLDKALKTFHDMVAKGLKPNIITYNTLLKGYFHCVKEGADSAMKFYEQMKQSSCKPDSVTYTTIIYNLCRRDCVQDAFDVYNDALNLGCQVKPRVMKYLAICLGRSGQEKEGTLIFERAKQKTAS